jgi:Reverse transcriptase (RNA-dependent DNA polymerase)/zinc-binding in reverse transcriptase
MTICTNRKACIILENGSFGENFNLERGNAQGDVISPFLFNICYQILLLKIEFNLQIEKIDLPAVTIEEEGQVLIGAVSSVSYRSKKVFAFADDCNILTSLNPESIIEITRVLNNFGAISGLECNVQKSHILPIGHEPAVPGAIRNLGFEIVDEMTVLGFKISNKDDLIEENCRTIIDRINSQKRVWVRYNLSLPGRINICKSMFYSQINYIGSVLPVPDEIIRQIENSIHEFVSGNLRISKQRTFLSVDRGGLGLFNIKNFIDAQICSWIRRASPVDQDWKVRLLGTGTGNLYRINESEILGNQFPITKNILRAFDCFRTKFGTIDNNYKFSYIVNNRSLTVGIRSREILTVNDILIEVNGDPERTRRLLNIRISDLVINGQKLNKANFTRTIGFDISVEFWRKLDKIRSAAILRYGSDDYLPVKTMERFFSEWKRGSKKIRNVLNKPATDFIPHNMVKYAENTEIIINFELSRYLNSIWNRGYFSNNFRVFLFKMHNNTLPYNTMLSHFVRDVGRNCSFCDILENPEEEDETILHLFFTCTVSERIRTEFYNWITNGTVNHVTRREFFGTFRSANNLLNEFLNIVTDLLKKFLWDSRTKKTLPSFVGLQNFIKDEILTMTRVSKKFKTIAMSSGLDLQNTLNIQF